MGALAVLVFGAAYASVPLYKVFCQMTGFGGTTQRVDDDESLLARVKPVEGGRIVRVDFTSNVHSAMPWSFKPTQRNVKVVPGETALAFYTGSFSRCSFSFSCGWHLLTHSHPTPFLSSRALHHYLYSSTQYNIHFKRNSFPSHLASLRAGGYS